MASWNGQVLAFGNNGDAFMTSPTTAINFYTVVFSNGGGAAADCSISDGTIEYARALVPAGSSLDLSVGGMIQPNRLVTFTGGGGCFARVYAR